MHRAIHAGFCVLALALGAWTAGGQEGVPAPFASPELSPPATTMPAPAESMASPAPEPSSPVPEPTAPPEPKRVSAISIEIDLQQQKAYLLHDKHKVYESPISSGRAGHLTPTGDFEVLEKDLNHLSSLYGQIVERGSGRIVHSGADVATPVPPGCKFVRAPMKHFMRFEGAVGMHAGILPGYPASHGCVRMPASKAKLFYNAAEIGSPVHVFGKTPSHTERPARRELVTQEQEQEPIAPEPTPAPTPRRGWPFWFRR
jgi:lipoprotein-anchoring transpeptidase ErfK/SrfK